MEIQFFLRIEYSFENPVLSKICLIVRYLGPAINAQNPSEKAQSRQIPEGPVLA